ncbi:MAG: flagellar basal body P-ring formation chaperone FlgA [Legionella sp.]|uniref:flagellar basal body P-ring formation chaperone FlgA n=1 Tax=Legionella sp. TaxID=459 RepID=UPI00283D82A3|nr:flagellar basal body P-ring formation chaperone FlgA [Legionella sp.]
MKFVVNLLLLLSVFPIQAETVLRFRTPITPEAKNLGDLLLITPDKHQWGKIMLDSKPMPGTKLNKQQVLTWLQHKVGNFSHQWKGKTSATIRETTGTNAKNLLSTAQNALAKQLKKQAYSQVELSSKTVLKDSGIALANFKIQLPKDYPVAKRVCVRLHYQNRSIPIWFAVKAYQSVLVAKHTIKRHTLLRPSDVILKRRNIAGLYTAPLTQFPATVWLNKSINKQQILTQDLLGNQPEVMQGQKTKVLVQQHGIAITIEAIAQSNGVQGQSIRMQNPRTNKYFVAVITGKNTAEVAA